jgi:PAS domain S-box-containing protein
MSRLPFRPRHEQPPLTEALSSALLENLADAVLACDAEGNIVVTNRRAREVLGAGSDPVPQADWTERCPIYRPDGTQVTRAEDLPLGRALHGEEVRDVRLEVRPNGTRHVMNVSGSAIRGPGGEIRGAIIVMQEITERADAERRLRLQGAIASRLAEGVALIRAADGVIVYTNARWDAMFLYRPGELTGKHISVVNAPAEQAPEERALEIMNALDRDGAWSGEVHNVRKDGSEFWSAASVSEFEDDEHGTVWITVHNDITERRASEDALREAEERFRRVFEDGPVAALVVSNDLRMTDVSQRFCELTGYRRDELVGRLCTDISHPEDLAAEADLAGRMAHGEIPAYRLEKRFATKHGDWIPVVQTTTAVRGGEGQPLYRVATVEERAGRAR